MRRVSFVPLGASSSGLVDAVAGAGLEPGESLLVVADQFEELFRFDLTREQQAGAALFVSALLEASTQRQVPIYVVLTMRSEFLGRCPEFSGLAEACNRSQYLVPRLTRDERQAAIERPLRLFDAVPTPALVQQVLNDAGDDPDLLPVLQHVMLRTYREWARDGGTGRIEQRHYQAVGGIERALDLHGDEILAQLDESGADARVIAERIFRSLTVVQNGVVLRRPRRIQELCDVIGAADATERARVHDVIAAFADRANSFLMLSSAEMTPHTVVDITHEGLIRKWRRLDAWVRDEARSAEWLDDLLRDVARRGTGEGSLWQDPELSTVLRRQRDEGWNEAWANQYRRETDPRFADVLTFLDRSSTEQAEHERQSAELRDRELRQAQALARASRRQAMILGLALLGVVLGVYLYFTARAASERKLAEATQAYQAALDRAQASAARVSALEAEQAALRANAGGAPASAADQARLQQLTRDIESARLQAQGSEAQLMKLKKDQELAASDHGALLKQIDALRQQLTQVTYERDRAVADSKGASTDDRVTSLTRQLEQERTRSSDANKEIARLNSELAALKAGSAASSSGTSGTSPAATSQSSAQDLTTAFGDGVRAYRPSQLVGCRPLPPGSVALADRGIAASERGPHVGHAFRSVLACVVSRCGAVPVARELRGRRCRARRRPTRPNLQT
ncbi:MAG: hypothetical protein QM736_24290 [Vicinamibacterales bacterium]